MQTLTTVIHVTTCVLLVLVVLLQSGKGAEISASFGGSSQTVFGTAGGANFFTRFTAVMAALFMVTSMVLTVMGSQGKKSVFEGEVAAPVSPVTVPVQPVGAPPAAVKPAAPAAKK